jgi:hypothetical protein
MPSRDLLNEITTWPNPFLQPFQIPRDDGDPTLRRLAAAVNKWLATHPQPLLELPRTRTTEQWITWLRAEGFIDAAPYGPTAW